MSVTSYDLVRQFHEKFGHPALDVPNDANLNDPKLRKLRVLLVAHELAELCQGLAVDLAFCYAHDGMDKLTGKELESAAISWCTPVDTAAEELTPPDMVKTADALGDLDVVVQGAHLVFGLPGPSIIAEIHRSNMSKLGADGLPLYNADGKILKGPNYQEADVATVVQIARNSFVKLDETFEKGVDGLTGNIAGL